MLILDFETRSQCDLKKKGSSNYCLDPSTDILCMAALCTDTESKWLWYPDEELPQALRYAIENADLVCAHNAEFDMGIYEIAVTDYGFPQIPKQKWYCSSAQCRVNAIPAGLDDAAWALGLKTRKYSKGAHLIKKLSMPRPDGTFLEDEELLIDMGDYCMQDVIVTTAVVRATRPMTQMEHQDWLKTVEVNQRGVLIDYDLATSALDYSDTEQSAIAIKLIDITDGVVTRHSQSARIRDWLVARLGDDHAIIKLMEVYKEGVKKLSLDKNIRRNILNMIENSEIIVDDDVRDVVQLLDDGNKSSVAKFKRMLEMCDEEDHRVRGAFVFAGASQTLRYTSRGLQLHNMRRDCWSADEAEHIAHLMAQGEPLEGDVMETLSKLLRPAIIPAQGNIFVVGDWSSIEARVLPWLSDSDGGDAKLQIFKDGKDVYIEAAKAMGLGESSRQIGKVAELALGYQGGVNAFNSMARNYGLSMSDAEAQGVVDKWRSTNAWAVRFWAELEQAAKDAISFPTKKFHAGMVTYLFAPDMMEGTLLCLMEGDTIIQYPKAKLEMVATKFGDRVQITALKASLKPKADAKQWLRTSIYGGLLAENCTQAFAAAILRNALRQLDDVVASVHDEIVLEVGYDESPTVLKNLQQLMEETPSWAEGLPLTAEPVIMRRYGK